MNDQPELSHAEEAIAAADHLVGNLYYQLDAVPVIAGVLHPDAMPNCEAKVIYGEMCRLHLQPDTHLSTGTLEMALRMKSFDFGYLGKLQSRLSLESVEALEEYADVVNNFADLRNLQMYCMQTLEDSRQPGARVETLVPQLINNVQAKNRVAGNTLHDISEFGDQFLEELDRWERGEISGRSTGFVDLDEFFRLEEELLIMLAGRPSMGKTSLGMAIMENLARQLVAEGDDGCVAIFSAEMSGKRLHMRMSCALAGINSQLLRKGKAAPQDYAAVREAAQRINELPVVIDESPSPSPEQMIYRLAMINARRPIRGMLFDFMELGSTDGKNDKQIQNEEQRISHIARGLKAVAKRLRIPVIALSQLSRKVEERMDKIPTLSDMRYSGMIEQIADVAAFIMRPEYYLKRNMLCYLDPSVGDASMGLEHPHGQNVAYVFTGKQRDGSVGPTALSFVERYTRFGDLAREKPLRF